MGRIKMRWFYTNLVEHYFRMGVRYDEVKGIVAKQWLDFTKDWIDKLYEDDREFIEFVFSYQFRTTEDGLAKYPSSETTEMKRLRLAKLGKRFAVDAELISKIEADRISQFVKESIIANQIEKQYSHLSSVK